MADESGNGGGNDVGDVFRLVLVSVVLRQVAAYGAKYIVPRAERSVETRQRLEQVTSILFVVLFLGYSGYNLYNDYLALPSNFYDLLRVDSYAAQDAIKSNYRKLSMMYHPDKNSDPRAQLEYVQIRRAFETLTHPVQRDVYNIFGSEVLESCKHCATYRDYLVFSILPVVIRAGFALAINVAILYFSSRFYLSFWVLLWIAGLALVELHSIVHVSNSLAWFLPSLTLPEKLQLLYKATPALTMAFSNVYNLIWPYQQLDRTVLITELRKGLAMERMQVVELIRGGPSMPSLASAAGVEPHDAPTSAVVVSGARRRQ